MEDNYLFKPQILTKVVKKVASFSKIATFSAVSIYSSSFICKYLNNPIVVNPNKTIIVNILSPLLIYV